MEANKKAKQLQNVPDISYPFSSLYPSHAVVSTMPAWRYCLHLLIFVARLFKPPLQAINGPYQSSDKAGSSASLVSRSKLGKETLRLALRSASSSSYKGLVFSYSEASPDYNCIRLVISTSRITKSVEGVREKTHVWLGLYGVAVTSSKLGNKPMLSNSLCG
ncbi:hypothetical protein RRG08_050025 [Elysia crispata]|uniref:Uncharacterized protein n=1 Tax=Elysia crispata TaxID=231223 RepID=A0AAE1EC40_9GAST|nr:hypothetical protein RRG08_050025 [Elysia crispata]